MHDRVDRPVRDTDLVEGPRELLGARRVGLGVGEGRTHCLDPPARSPERALPRHQVEPAPQLLALRLAGLALQRVDHCLPQCRPILDAVERRGNRERRATDHRDAAAIADRHGMRGLGRNPVAAAEEHHERVRPQPDRVAGGDPRWTRLDLLAQQPVATQDQIQIAPSRRERVQYAVDRDRSAAFDPDGAHCHTRPLAHECACDTACPGPRAVRPTDRRDPEPDRA